MIDEMDPSEKLKADLAGVQDPDAKALILVRNTLEMATDVMNGEDLPEDMREDANGVLEEIGRALGGEIPKDVVLKNCSERLRDWLKSEELDDLGQELRALKKLVDRAPGVIGVPVENSLSQSR